VTAAEWPVLTYYDDATGERVALSAADLGGWAARTARLLRDGCRLGPGSRVAVVLPPHWLTAAVLLGSWSAGAAVSVRLPATAGLAANGPGDQEPFDAVFASLGAVDDWLVDVPDATHRFALAVGDDRRPVDLPIGYRQFADAIAAYADRPDPDVWLRATDPASVDGTTYGQWGALARSVAAEHDLRTGDRIMVTAQAHLHPVTWLLAPLSAGATVVLCANPDPALRDARAAAEGVTRVL